MILDHVAIWTKRLEELKDFYIKHFNGRSNEKYVNPGKRFESYFISFDSGARIELMQMTGIPDNLNDRLGRQHTGIIHLAFGVKTMQDVLTKAKELEEAGITIISGPRLTGDGYFEFETCDPDNNRIEVSTLYRE